MRKLLLLGIAFFRLLSAFAIVVCTSATLAADPITFVGFDNEAGSGDARPNADSAAAQFDIAAGLLGSLTVTTFESAETGPLSTVAIDGMTLTGTDFEGRDQQLRDTAAGTAVLGYNTTSGGTNYVQLSGGTLSSTFATPVQAFGFYITGAQIANRVTFNDGSPQSYTLPFGALTSAAFGGGVGFFGFIDEDASISRITIHATTDEGLGDIIGIDDMFRVASSQTPIPEPTSAILLSLGLGALGVRQWWQRKT